MKDYADKKLSPSLEMSKKFIEKYMNEGQFTRNNYGDVAINGIEDGEGQAGFPDNEEIAKALKSLKRIKALES